MKSAGVIVTFNRSKELIKNLEANSNQSFSFDMIYIIDNGSTDDTEDVLKERGYLADKKIEYIKLKNNIGGAGGFYEGTKRAFEDGYDYICLMDDDGRPLNNNTFEILIKKANKLYKINKKLMLNCLVICNERTRQLSFGLDGCKYSDDIVKRANDDVLYNHINPFNGTLITRELIEIIGLPNKEFFIRGDEVDYQCRAQKTGALICTVIDSLYYHPYLGVKIIKWKKKYIYFDICPPWKEYYLVRNTLYRIKNDRGIFSVYKYLLFQIYGTIMYNPERISCLKYIFKGYRDAIKGRLGVRVKPGQK